MRGRVCCAASRLCLRASGSACVPARRRAPTLSRSGSSIPASPCPTLTCVCDRPIAGMPQPVATGRRPKGPPCVVPDCTDNTNPSGQWCYLPEAYLLLHPDLDKDDCHCHSRLCRRAVGKGEPKQPRGCKRVRADSSSVSAGLRAADELPRPPIFVSIDEIWAVRYGMLSPQCVPACRHALQSLQSLDPCLSHSCQLYPWQVCGL